MTYLERLAQIEPELAGHIKRYPTPCPEHYFDTEIQVNFSCLHADCSQCWNREYKGEEYIK